MPDGPAHRTWHYRHALTTRLCHWVTVLCLLVLVPSGLQIFNAHPALYWGERSDPDRALLALRAVPGPDEELRGITEVLGHRFDTTGLLGASIEDGERVERGFPVWTTLPGSQWLAMGRRWHFFFAWLFVLNALAFAIYALPSRHATRDLVPGPRDLAGLGTSLRDHLRLRFPRGEAEYNVLQKLAYVVVIAILGPLVVLTGLAMSPWIDATLPLLPALFGGRQSARTVHFATTFAFLGFTIVHVFMVAASGLRDNLRGIVTGWMHARRDPDA
jgi:thiosulfate reductase cytochrome b subunit